MSAYYDRWCEQAYAGTCEGCGVLGMVRAYVGGSVRCYICAHVPPPTNPELRSVIHAVSVLFQELKPPKKPRKPRGPKARTLHVQGMSRAR